MDEILSIVAPIEDMETSLPSSSLMSPPVEVLTIENVDLQESSNDKGTVYTYNIQFYLHDAHDCVL